MKRAFSQIAAQRVCWAMPSHLSPARAAPRVLGLYAGAPRPLGGGRPSAIVKEALHGPALLGLNGLAGDQQADRRLHGGPLKALHLFPTSHYALLAARFPAIGELLVPGSIGENVALDGLDENSVCLGDVYRLGAALVEVTQPRSPCAKIDRRYGEDGVARWLQQAGRCGWYCRVLEAGEVASGDALTLLVRAPDAVSLARFHAVLGEPRPPLPLLERLAGFEPLGPDWLKKLRGRLAWLARHT